MAKFLSARTIVAALMLAGCGAASGGLSPLAGPVPPTAKPSSSEPQAAEPPSSEPKAEPPKNDSPYSDAEIADPEVENWQPRLGISPPLGWRPLPFAQLEKGDYGKLVDRRHDASIVIRTKPSKGTASEESLRLQSEMVTNGQGWRVIEMKQRSASGDYVEFVLLSADDERTVRVSVRRYGKDGQVSVTFIGSWLMKTDHTSSPDYRGVVDGTSLLSEKEK